MALIDTHIHLNDEIYQSEAAEIAANFELDGIECAINVGYDFPSSVKALEQANEFNHLCAAIGIHPHDSRTATQDMYDEFIKMARDNHVVAIGEIGLDYHWDADFKEAQKKVFREQIELADMLHLPIMLHIREAYDDARQILSDAKSYLNNGVHMHCYSGSKEMLDIFNKFDCYYSFGGAITFKNARRNVEALMNVPKDRLLTETDCPYMTPVPYRGKVNYPKYVNLVADKMSEVLGLEREEIDSITVNNAKMLYKRMR